MATYFWVGGTGTWDATTTTNWASSSGGAGGAGVPATGDTVILDANSGTGTITANSGTNTCSSLLCDGSGAGASGSYAGTLTSTNLGVRGTLGPVKFSAGMTITAGFLLNIVSASGTMNLTTAGQNLTNITVQNSAAVLALQDACTASGVVSFIAGTINTNGQTCTWGSLTSSGISTRVLTLGSSAITINTTAGWVFGTTNCSVTTNTATITFTGVSPSINLGSINYNGTTIVVNSTGAASWGSGPTVATLTYTPAAGSTNALIIGPSLTVTVTGTLTLTGSSGGGQRILVESSIAGTATTLSAATVTATYCDFQDITAAGSASWNLVAITGLSGDCGGNSGITLTASATQYYVGGTANWSTASAWANASGGTAGSGRSPLPQDPAIFDVHSFPSASQTITINNGGRLCASLNFTGVVNNPTIALSIAPLIYGSLTLIAGMTFSGGAHSYTLAGRGAYTLTNAGQAGYLLNLTIAAPGGTYTPQDATTISSGFSITAGTFDNSVNNVAISAGTFASTGSVTRAYKMGTSTLTLNASGTIWQTNSTSSLTVSTCTVVFAATAGTSTITTGGVTMPTTTINGAGGTVQFSDGYTTAGSVTVTSGTLNTNGQTCTWSGVFTSAGSLTRVITLGNSAINLSLAGGVALNFAGTGLTITANTATVTFTGAGPTVTNQATSWNGASVVINGTGIIIWNSTQGGLANLTYTPTAGAANIFSTTQAVTVTGTLTLTGAAAPNRILVQSNVVGTARTITAATTAITYCDFQDITAAGLGNWSTPDASGWGNCGGNSGITFTTAQTNYWVGNTANWSSTSAWASSSGGSAGSGRVPLPQDNATFDASSFTATGKTVTSDCARACATVTWATVTNSPTWSGFNSGFGMAFFGSFTLGAITIGTRFNPALSGRASYIIDTKGVALPASTTVSILAPGGTYVPNSAFTVGASTAGGITNSAGTFDNSVNNAAISVPVIAGSGGAWKLGSATWTLTGTGSVWNPASAATVTAGTSTILIADTSSTSKTFSGTGKTYGTLQIASGGTGAVIITGANTFATLIATSQTQLIFPSATTQTISTAAGWQVAGTNFGYQFLPGVSGNYASTPDASPLDITGDIDLRAKIALVSWSSTPGISLISKINGSNTNTAYEFRIQANGTFRLLLNAGTGNVTVVSSAATGFAANAVEWVRVTWKQSTGTTTFYTSTDGTTWTQLGTTQTLSVPSIANVTTEVEIGSYANGTQVFGPITFYRAQIYNGIAGTLVFDANFATKPVGANTFTESSSNAATVTINGAAAQAGDGRVLVAASTPGSAATISVASGIVQSNYLSLQDSTATGGATFNAGSGSTSISNNSGWIFTSIWYWVSGAGTWDGSTTTNWALSSGGGGSAGVPAGSDTVILDSNSGAGTISCASGAVCSALLCDGSGSGASGSYAGSLNNGNNLGFHGTLGNCYLSSGMTLDSNFIVNISNASPAATGTMNLKTAGHTLSQIVVQSTGAGATLVLQDTTTVTTVQLVAGTLNTNGQTCSWGTFTSINSAFTCVLTLGASTITLTTVGSIPWETVGSHLTVNAGTSTIQTPSGSSTSNALYFFGSFTYNNVIIYLNNNAPRILGGTLANLSVIVQSGATCGLNLTTGSPATTVTGTLTLTGLAAPNRLLFASNVLGTACTITCNGTVTASYVDFQDITGAGTASWNLSAITGGAGDCQGNSGITFTAAQTNYWVGNTANWSSTSAWASSSGGSAGSGRVPLPQDGVVFDANSFTATGKTVTSDCARIGASTSWTGVTNNPTWTNSLKWTVYGSLTLISGMSFAAPNSPLTLAGRSTYTLTTAGKTIPSLGVSAPGGTYTLADSVNMSAGVLTIGAGTLDAATNNVNVTTLQLESTGSITRQLNMGSGIWTLTLSSGHVCDIVATGLTLNAGTSTVLVSDTGASQKIIAMGGGGCNFYNLQIASGGTGMVSFGNSSQSFNAIICNGPKTITFTSGTTTTIAPGGWRFNGNSGSLVTITGGTPGSAATISMASGTAVSQYLSLKDMTLTGGATIYAANSTNVSNNTGWNFSNPATIGQNMMSGMGS
jgi:hypothetical protein